VLLATMGPVGHVPVAPGTAASLVGLPLLPGLAALRARSAAAYACALVALLVVAVWAATRAEQALGARDASSIVIDELAGIAVAGILLPGTWAAAALAFVLFRLFDVVKPFPAGWVDAHLHGGLGVVGDDVVAAVYASVAACLLLGFA